MNVESWLGLGSLALVIIGAIVTFAMMLARTQAELKAERESRKDGDDDLADKIRQETADRKKRDSDVILELREHDRRLRRAEQRRAEMRRHDTPQDEDQNNE